MQNMKCIECVLKHLAAAISYSKEVQAGHGRNAELDHRPDLLGELVNAEHHLKLIDSGLCQAVNSLRNKLQANGINPGLGEIEYIRRLWKLAENKYLPTEFSTISGSCIPCNKSRIPTVDIVIPLAEKGAHNNLELRYALRSIEKYAHGIRDIIVISRNAPAWIRKVKIIDYITDSKRKNITLFRKRLEAAKQSDADYNLYWCDDYILLKTMNVMNIPTLYNGKNLLDYSERRVWHQCLKATGETLHRYSKTTMNCESHTPSLNNRKKFIQLADIFNDERETEPGLTVCALYHNYYGSRMLEIGKFKATFEKKVKVAEVREKAKDKMFLGYNDKGFESGVKGFLAEKFPKKSKYEV